MPNFGDAFPRKEGKPLVILEERPKSDPYIQIGVVIKQSYSTLKVLRLVLKWLRRNGWK